MPKDILLIPGTWARVSSWGKFPDALEDIGFRVHAPDLLYHDLPYEKVEEIIGGISINDYVSDFLKLAQYLGPDVFILGHSLGGLIAQLVGARVKHKGLILLGPAPSSSIFALYPKMVHGFYRHFLRWGFWKKPMPPYKDTYFSYVTNLQDQETKERLFSELVPESGRVYAEMSLPFLDKDKSTRVDFEKIQNPVLVITGSHDYIVNPQIAKDTASKYNQAKLVSIENSDHMYTSDRIMDRTIEEIILWMEEKGL